MFEKHQQRFQYIRKLSEPFLLNYCTIRSEDNMA